MNQKQLGELIGVGKTTVSNYEKGNSFPTFDGLTKIREYFNVDLEQLVYTDLSQNQSNNVSNDASVMQRLAELEARQSETDALFDRLFSPKDFDKLLSLFTEEFQMSLPELKEFFNQEVERRLKGEG